MKKIVILLLVVMTISALAAFAQHVPQAAAQSRQPQLELTGARTPTLAEFSTANTAFENVLILEEKNGRSISDLRVTATALKGANAEAPLAVTVLNIRRGPPYAVRASGSLQLQVSATLSASGVYTGQVTLSYAGKRDNITVVVQRAQLTPSNPDGPSKLELYSPIAINGLITVEVSKPDSVIPLFLSEVNGKTSAGCKPPFRPWLGQMATPSI